MHIHDVEMRTEDIALQKSLITKQKCFSRLTESELDMLSGLLEKVHYDVGNTIVTEGDPVDSVYFIINGTAEVRHVYLENSKETFQSITTLTKDQSIGLSETGFYSVSGLRTATVVAKTTLDAFRLSVAAFNGFVLAYPHVQKMLQNASAAAKG